MPNTPVPVYQTPTWVHINGSPEGRFSAPVGTICIDRVLGVLYIKQTPEPSNTGWSQISTTPAAGSNFKIEGGRLVLKNVDTGLYNAPYAAGADGSQTVVADVGQT